MNLVTSVVEDDMFNPHLCVICQEDTKLPATK
jgi:hypothetical protein